MHYFLKEGIFCIIFGEEGLFSIFLKRDYFALFLVKEGLCSIFFVLKRDYFAVRFAFSQHAP